LLQAILLLLPPVLLLPLAMCHCLLLPAIDRLSSHVNGAICLLLSLLLHHLLLHLLQSAA
jgi:hypothetical protein